VVIAKVALRVSPLKSRRGTFCKINALQANHRGIQGRVSIFTNTSFKGHYMIDTKNEMVKADKKYRGKLFLGYLIAVFVGVIIWNFIVPPFLIYMENLPNKELVETNEMICHLFLLCFIPVAIYVIIIGRRICRFKAIPYPGMRVIRDTVVVTGKKAMARGKSLIILGIVTIILVVTSMISTHYIILNFKQHPLFRPVFYETME
jgi:hypothetical protein